MSTFDLAFIGNYTKDTIVDPAGSRTVDGGAFYYGANVACRLGYRTAAVTRLCEADLRVVERLKELGVEVFYELAPRSTVLRLVYPGENPDQRRIFVDSSAGSLRPAQVKDLEARVAVIGASFRGEVSPTILKILKGKTARIALDVQGFVRVVREGILDFQSWPQKTRVLRLVDILKADAVEAEMLTGASDPVKAAAALLEAGPEEVVITHKEGVLVCDGKGSYQAGFFPRRMVGRSGRGDTCLAAYACRRLDGEPAEAAVWAAAVTSLKMESSGPFRSSRREVERLLRARYATPDRGG
jgi:sugar/nucleoside kinase (ribokinase family)